MVKKVEKFVFYPKRLYGAKNGQILETVVFYFRKKRKAPSKKRGFLRQ